MAEFWVLVGGVVVLSLMLLWFLGESAALLCQAWMYRQAKKEGTLHLAWDGFWYGELAGLVIQERWGPLKVLGTLIAESVILGILTEVWIAVLVFVLYLALFLGMGFATRVIKPHLPRPPVHTPH